MRVSRSLYKEESGREGRAARPEFELEHLRPMMLDGTTTDSCLKKIENRSIQKVRSIP
jgi:hypothetical protein